MLSIHSIVLDIMYPPQGRGCSCRLQLPTMNQGKLITVSLNLNKRITSKDKSQNGIVYRAAHDVWLSINHVASFCLLASVF